MSVVDFFLRLHDPASYGHFYFSEPVNRFSDDIISDVSPFDFLLPVQLGIRTPTIFLRYSYTIVFSCLCSFLDRNER